MQFFTRLVLCASAVWLGAALTGCSPTGQSRLDEEKEPHFVLGKSYVNAMSYEDALASFQQSLEVNPRSAAAHFELGWLYEKKVPDPAAAIYHYEQYLKLNPNADNAALIKQHVDACKQQLAADVMPLPSAPAAQQQLDKLAEENRRLQDEVDKWRAYYASQQAAAKTNRPVVPNNSTANSTAPPPVTSLIPDDISSQSPITPTVVSPIKPAPVKPVKPRTYKIADGDTPAAIARKYNVKLDALLAANPGLNPKHLRVGQIVNLP